MDKKDTYQKLETSNLPTPCSFAQGYGAQEALAGKPETALVVYHTKLIRA